MADLIIPSTYVGDMITNIKIYGQYGLYFSNNDADSTESYGYFYYSNDLPAGLEILQEDESHQYGRIVGAFSLPSVSGGSFHVGVRDAGGDTVEFEVAYEPIRQKLTFTHYVEFDYGDLTVGEKIPNRDVSKGVYGGVPPYTFYASGDSDVWRELEIYEEKGIIVNGRVRSKQLGGASFQVWVIDSMGTESNHITITTGAVYDKPSIEAVSMGWTIVDNGSSYYFQRRLTWNVSSSAPKYASTGTLYYNYNTDILYKYDGEKWNIEVIKVLEDHAETYFLQYNSLWIRGRGTNIPKKLSPAIGGDDYMVAGQEFTDVIRIHVEDGVPFNDTFKYQFSAEQLLPDFQIVRENYVEDGIEYQAKIVGRPLVASESREATITVIDSRGETDTLVIPIAEIKGPLAFKPDEPITFAPRYTTDLTVETQTIKASYISGGFGDSYSFELLDEPSGKLRSLGISMVSGNFQGDPIFVTDKSLLEIDPNVRAPEQFNVGDLVWDITNSYLYECGSNFNWVVLPPETGYKYRYDSTSGITWKVRIGYSDKVVISRFPSESFVKAQPATVIILRISDGHSTIDYPIQVGEIVDKFEWEIGREGNNNTKLTNIYIDPLEITFTEDQIDNGKLVNIWLVKQKLFKDDPLASTLLQTKGKTIKDFWDDNSLTFTANDISDSQLLAWKAWASKYGISGNVSNYAKTDLATYLTKVVRQAGYISGGGVPYTISILDSNRHILAEDSADIAPFKIIQREFDRELQPEDIRLSGIMTTQSLTPKEGTIIRLTDSFGQSIEYSFGARQVPKVPLFVRFINSLDDKVIINEMASFYKWPFLVVGGEGYQNITCAWRNNSSSWATSLSIGSYSDATLKRKYYYFSTNQNSTLTISDNDLTSFIDNDYDLSKVIIVKQGNSEITPLGTFLMSGIIKKPSMRNEAGISIAPCYRGQMFPGATIHDGNQVFNPPIFNAIFSTNPPNFKYSSQLQVQGSSENLSKIGLAINEDTGAISGVFSFPNNSYYSNLIFTIKATYSGESYTPTTTIPLGETSSISMSDTNFTKNLTFKGISDELVYNTDNLKIPRILTSSSDYKNKTFSCLLNKNGNSARVSGGIPAYSWKLADDLGVFRIVGSGTNVALQLKTGTIPSSMTPRDLRIIVTDSVGNSVEKVVRFLGIGKKFTSLTKINTLNNISNNSGSGPFYCFKIRSGEVGESFPGYALYRGTENNNVWNNSVLSNLDFLKYVQGGTIGDIPTQESIEAARPYMTAEITIGSAYNRYNLNDCVLSGSPSSITSAEQKMEIKITDTNLIGSDLNDSVTFIVYILRIYSGFGWDRPIISVMNPDPYNSGIVETIDLTDYLLTGSTSDITPTFALKNGNVSGTISVSGNNLAWITPTTKLQEPVQYVVTAKKGDIKKEVIVEVGVDELTWKDGVTTIGKGTVVTGSANKTVTFNRLRTYQTYGVDSQISLANLISGGKKPISFTLTDTSGWANVGGSITLDSDSGNLVIVSPLTTTNSSVTIEFKIKDSSSTTLTGNLVLGVVKEPLKFDFPQMSFNTVRYLTEDQDGPLDPSNRRWYGPYILTHSMHDYHHFLTTDLEDWDFSLLVRCRKVTVFVDIADINDNSGLLTTYFGFNLSPTIKLNSSSTINTIIQVNNSTGYGGRNENILQIKRNNELTDLNYIPYLTAYVVDEVGLSVSTSENLTDKILNNYDYIKIEIPFYNPTIDDRDKISLKWTPSANYTPPLGLNFDVQQHYPNLISSGNIVELEHPLRWRTFYTENNGVTYNEVESGGLELKGTSVYYSARPDPGISPLTTFVKLNVYQNNNLVHDTYIRVEGVGTE